MPAQVLIVSIHHGTALPVSVGLGTNLERVPWETVRAGTRAVANHIQRYER